MTAFMAKLNNDDIDDGGDASKAPDTDETPQAKAAPETPLPRKEGWRETIESVVIAFILAFLFRTFEAEAFVIPTGSMAPTLYGRHKEITCPECKHVYAVGASRELDRDGHFLESEMREAVCPNCRFLTRVDNVPGTNDERFPVFKGDRILVNKFPFEFSDPKRWDIVVFKFPEHPQTNYIKRLVGLPGETLRIQQGDVYARKGQDAPLRILSKDDPDKQREVRILVYDDAFPERRLHKLGWPERWAAVTRDNAPGHIAGWSDDNIGWKQDAKTRTFRLSTDNGEKPERKWIRYRHFLPRTSDWVSAANGRQEELDARNRLQLITDFCGYNATDGSPDMERGLYWVGDLMLSCHVEIDKVDQQPELLFELNEGWRWYRCRIDVATGKATLSHTDSLSRDEKDEIVLATADTSVTGQGGFDIRFANVDDRLCVWIDDDLVEFGPQAAYKPHGGFNSLQEPTDNDLAPVGIAARGLGVTVSGLLLERDLYYRSELMHPDSQFDDDQYSGGRTISEYDSQSARREFESLLTDPTAWFEEYERDLSARKTRGGGESNDDLDDIDLGNGPNGSVSDRYAGVSFEFELGPDEFFMMGDNSPSSKDSRLWSNTRRAEHRHAVPRSALVGKAFYIYWPHGVPFLNDGRGYPGNADSALNNRFLAWLFYHREFDGELSDYPSFRVPFYPNIGRMRRLR
jgi:signal peptidase I